MTEKSVGRVHLLVNIKHNRNIYRNTRYINIMILKHDFKYKSLVLKCTVSLRMMYFETLTFSLLFLVRESSKVYFLKVLDFTKVSGIT